MSRPAWRDLALKTRALGNSPDSIAASFEESGLGLLQARPPLTAADLVSQVFQVAKPFTLPENERSQAPALKPISAYAAEALPRARAAAAASEIVLCFMTCIMCPLPLKSVTINTLLLRKLYTRRTSCGKRSKSEQCSNSCAIQRGVNHGHSRGGRA